MSEISALKKGCTTRFAVLDDDGMELEFRLAVVGRPAWDGQEQLEFRYVNEAHGLVADGTYSGGVTGSGCDRWSRLGDEESYLTRGLRIVTTDLRDLMVMAAKATADAEAERERLDRAKTEACRRINALPEAWLACTYGGKKYFVTRGTAVCRPARSSRFMPYLNAQVKDLAAMVGENFYYNQCLDKHGRVLKAKAKKLFGPDGPAIVEALVKKQAEVRDLMQSIIYQCENEVK